MSMRRALGRTGIGQADRAVIEAEKVVTVAAEAEVGTVIKPVASPLSLTGKSFFFCLMDARGLIRSDAQACGARHSSKLRPFTV